MNVLRTVLASILAILFFAACSDTVIQNQQITDGDLDTDKEESIDSEDLVDEIIADGDIEIDGDKETDGDIVDIVDFEENIEADGDTVEQIEDDGIDPAEEVEDDTESDGDVEVVDNTEEPESDGDVIEDDTVVEQETVDGDITENDVTDNADSDTVEDDTVDIEPEVIEEETEAEAEIVCTCSTLDDCCDGCNPVNQGGSCNDGDPDTGRERCDAGICVGVPCTCDGPTTCCDGCFAINNGGDCDDGNANTGADVCDDGTCQGIACECSFQNACCDGCFIINEGGGCDDANLCTLEDYCSAGSCIPGNERPCFALDQCKDSTCNPNTGACEVFNKDDATQCDDGNLCTQTDTCQSGTCQGGNPVECLPSGQCKQAACNSSTGACEERNLADSSPCNDENQCTRTDVCLSGVCQGTNPVQCTALDDCHLAGICNSESGQCTNPVVPDNTACDDGNAATGNDYCVAGVCLGDDCDCSGINTCCDGCFVLNDGARCENEGLDCTTDTCDSGICTHTLQTGYCLIDSACYMDSDDNPANYCQYCDTVFATDRWRNKQNGIECDDNDLCSTRDRCASGICTGYDWVSCNPPLQCFMEGVCQPDTGDCTYAPQPNGTGCDDGNLCTQTDECTDGACTGLDEIVCTPVDDCHGAGFCDEATAICSEPLLTNTTYCNYNNTGDETGRCYTGVCEELVVPSNNTCDGAEEVSGEYGTYYIDVDTRFADNNYEASCGGSAKGYEVVYSFTLTADTHYVILTDGNYDSVLYLRSDPCETGTELVCNDDAFAYPNYGSMISGDLGPGTYYFFVDGFGYPTPKPGTSVVTVALSAPVVDGDVDVVDDTETVDADVEADLEASCTAITCLPIFSEATWTAVDTPVATADNTTVASNINIAGIGGAETLTASINVAHPYPTSLTVTLRSPCGSEYIIQDQAATTISGDYPIPNMQGIPLNGTWSLLVTDNDGFDDVGQIVSFSLSNSCATSVDGDVDVADIPAETEDPQVGITIYDIQNNTSPAHPAVNTAILTVPVLVMSEIFPMSATLNGFMVGDAIDYGPWKGIQVVVDTTLVTLPALRTGDMVVIEGTYEEYYGLSEINASAVTVRGSATVPNPIFIADPAQFVNDPDFAESYEGIFIEIHNVTVLANDLGYDEMLLTGDFRVDDHIYDYNPPLPAVGTTYTVMRGFVGYSYGTYRIWPRDAEDMVEVP